MSKIFKREAINASHESLPKQFLRGLGQAATGAIAGTPAPLSKHRPLEAISFFNAPAPNLPLADELDRLDAAADEEMIAAQMSHIEIHKAED